MCGVFRSKFYYWRCFCCFLSFPAVNSCSLLDLPYAFDLNNCYYFRVNEPLKQKVLCFFRTAVLLRKMTDPFKYINRSVKRCCHFI